MKDILDFMEPISPKITLGESSILFFKEKIKDFDSNLLTIDIENNFGFSISIMYSIDTNENSKNWSLPKSINEFEKEILYFKQLSNINETDFYCYLKFVFKIIDDSNNIFTKFNQPSNYFPEIIINDILYNNESLIQKNLFELTQYIDIVNKFPRWNLYDNQQIIIDRWLSQCVSVTMLTGHKCLYFKTEPLLNDIENTLQTITKRDVASIKQLTFSCPDNNLPNDRNIISEWDMPMIDDFVIHIPNLLFQIIFGNEIPSSKDFIYLPILNKIYTINSVQPGEKYMGVTGWWECYLIKYEDDENIDKNKVFSNDLKTGLNSVLELVPNLDNESISDLYEKFENILDDGIIDSEKISDETNEEKKEVTNNFSNKLVDSNSFVSLKETENQRKFYNKRLNIVTINPDSLAFPLNMYNASTIGLNQIGVNYDLIDATKINKFNTYITKESTLLITFNFVLLKRFSGTIIDILSNNEIVFSIKNKGKNLIILKNNVEYILNYKFEEDFFYQINITEKNVTIFLLENKQKRMVHIYDYELFNDLDNFKFTSININGGNYYLGQFLLKINNNKILEDKTLPVLNMNSFGL